MNDDERFLRRAIELAARSASAGGGPVGAVVARGGALVAEGANGVVSTGDPTAHAEVVAIRAAAAALGTHVLDDCTLYSSCEPCPMCLGATHWARVGRMVFAADRHDAARAGFDDELLYREVALPPGRRALPTERMLADQGLEPFRVWQSNQGRSPY
jgi:guanine deaminase